MFTWFLPLLLIFAGHQFLRPTPCARGSQNILAPAPLTLSLGSPPAQIRGGGGSVQHTLIGNNSSQRLCRKGTGTQLCLASRSPSWSRPYLKIFSTFYSMFMPGVSLSNFTFNHCTSKQSFLSIKMFKNFMPNRCVVSFIIIVVFTKSYTPPHQSPGLNG